MRNQQWLLRTLLACGAAAGALSSGSAWAAAASPSRDAPATVGEVVVTANKRAERIQDVAMAVSAVGGDALAQTQALDLQDISTKVPGLNLQMFGTAGINRIILRGQNSGGDGATVATVLDDVPLSFSAANTDGGVLASDFDTYDLQRIEVLRGPQGTLYGATAEGGLVKYVSNLPNVNAYHGGFELGGLDYAHGDNGGSAKGYVNIPFMDGKAAIRASGFYENVPGYIDNPNLGVKDFNGGFKYGGRASVLFQPTPDFTARVTAVYQTLRQRGDNTIEVLGGLAATPGAQFDMPAGEAFNTRIPDVARNRLELYSLSLDDDLHWGHVQSITSYGVVHEIWDQDVPSLDGLLGPGTVIEDIDIHDVKKFNQEFRVASDPDSSLFGHKVDWQVGGFFTHESVGFDQRYLLEDSSRNLLGTAFIGLVPSDYKELAGYADATFHFNDRFDIEAGGRVSHNWQHSQVTEGGLLFVGTGPNLVLDPIHTAETSATFSVAPRWHITPDTLLYARVASGFRPGGPEIPLVGGPPGLPDQFKSDKTVNYEVGLKAQLFDRRVSIDVAAFYINWTDVQITSTYVVAGQSYNITGNAGTAVSEGVEWNLNWSPVAGLNIGAVGAYTDPHLSEDAPGIGGFKGDKLAYVPDWANSFNLDYEWPVFADYRAFVGGSWTYTGHRYNDFPTHVLLPTYNTYDARVGVKGGNYTVEVFGKNLSDAKGISAYTPTGAFLGGGLVSLIRPRTVGVRVTADF